jgi:peptidylprolyl isomerase/FKBP-type peptidyl-prolyl cis-trans isomerase FkpA
MSPKVWIITVIIVAVAIVAFALSRSSRKAANSTGNGPTPVTGPGVRTPDGLQYWDIKVGTGAKAIPGETVRVRYIGWLANGKEFDRSGDEPFTFDLGSGHVIKGWDEGVAGMHIGGKRQLRIPPELGYGERGAGGGVIPPNATLIFDVELVGIQ